MDENLLTLKGIGPGRLKQLNKLGIHSVSGLLTYFPRAYEDRSQTYKIEELKQGQVASIVGTIVHVQEKKPRRRLSILEIMIADETGQLKIVFFNQEYKKNFYKIGLRLHAYGKVELAYGGWQMNTPQVESLPEGAALEQGILPVYPLVDGVSQYVVRQAVRNWFMSHQEMADILPETIVRLHSFMPRYEAFKEMHFPTSLERYKMAREQLAYEELFVMQAGLLLLRSHEQVEKGIKLGPNGSLIKGFLASLPFSLTGDQQKAFATIDFDMQSERPMRRLLQGDVGSGKTIVGVLSLLKVVENGYQGALMAPTEILATQHYETIKKLCADLPITIGLLVGSMKAQEKKAVYNELVKGNIDIVIGTHALIQEQVAFKKLALAIIDEQHRFGVKQRAVLQEKGLNPHVLVMTATPIPRTMALSVYGDLEVSLIKEMPPGRKAVRTYVVNSSYKERLLTFFGREVQAGHQVYIVCPLVEESEKLDLKAAEELYLELLDYYGNSLMVGMVHGRMAGAEKEAIMADFYANRIHILVSTTVIEVGVDVPNATIMCVVGAERFGLSQLHQLRGRVGRGSEQGHCILVSDSRGEEAKARLSLMGKTQDGFVLAEQDLVLRGSGQLFGYAQHGLPDLRVANIISDIDLLIQARRDVKAYLEAEGAAQFELLMKEELRHRFGNAFLTILYN